MSILVVIVNYNGIDLTLACLESLQEEIRSIDAARVALCDNGSQPEEAERLSQAIRDHGWEQWIDYIRLPINLGFTGGNNAAIKPALLSSAPPDYVMLLNNDTIIRPGAIASLVDYMESMPAVGIAGSRLEYLDSAPQVSAFRFLNWLSEFDRGLELGFVSRLLSKYLVIQPVPDNAGAADWVSGASMIVRRQAMEQVDALDEDFYTYFDDIDICRSARNLGWDVHYVPASRVVHFIAQTTGVERDKKAGKRIPTYYLEARRRYLTKHLHPIHALACDVAFLAGRSLNRLRCFVTGKDRVFPESGLIDHLSQSTIVRGFKPPLVGNPALQASSLE